MATLYFKVESDLQKVKDLRAEISRLEAQMKSFGRNTSAEEIKHTEERLTAAKSKFTELANEAAKAGAVMESGFKKKVYEASQTINSYTEKIIEQKSVIKGVENDVRKLSEAYGRAVKNKSPKANSILQELNASKAALNEEKAALFGLTQEQAKARLSLKKLRDEYAAFKGSSKGMTDTMDGISAQIKKWGAGLLAGYGIKEFASQVIRVRGEFQQMETSIKTLVGESKANELIPQIKEMAKVSPLTMSDIVGAEQMMLGFNIAADDTVKYLRALSDVSMGNSQKFNSLTLAFSQMSASGKLMGQDLNQMINAGFNPLQAISDKTGKSIAQLKKEMSSGAISAEMVQQAFIDATSAGGKFYKMSEEGSKTINGQISMMEDAMDSALNEIGKSSEGLIMAGIQGVTKLIENYETVGSVLIGLVAVYGTYKAAVIATVAAEKAMAVARLASIKGITLQTLAQQALNKAIMANPIALIAAALMGAAVGFVKLSKHINESTSSYNRVKNASEEYTKQLDEEYQQAQNAISVIQDESKSQAQKVVEYNKLKSLVPEITKLYKMEELAILSVAEANKILSQSREGDEEQKRKEEINSLQNIVNYYEKAANRAKTAGRKKSANALLNNPDYKNAKAELERLKALDKEIQDANTQVEVKNKEYWEKKKKAAQARLEAMESSAKGSADWLKLEKEIAQYQKEIDKYSTSKTTKTEKDNNSQEAKKRESIAKIKEMKDAVIEDEQQAQFEIRQAEINSMVDSTDKVIAQIHLDYDRRIAENERRKQEFIKSLADQKALEWEVANPDKVKKGEKFDKSTVTEEDLTPQQNSILKFYDEIAKKEKETGTLNANKQLLEQYQTYAQKRLEIEEKFARDRYDMVNEDGSYKEGFSKENENELNRQRTDALAEVDLEFAMRDQQFESWANQVANLSITKLQELLLQAKQELGQMERDNKMAEEMGVKPKYSSEQMMKARGKVAVLEDNVKDAKLTPGKRSTKEWQDLYKTLREVEGQFKEIGDAVGGTAGEIISTAGEIGGSALSMINGIITLRDMAMTSTEQTAQTTSQAIQQVERASVILAIIGTAIKIITKIVNLASQIHDAKHEKRIQSMQKQVDALEKTYEKLGDAIEKAYSTDASKLIEQQNQLLEQQKTLIQQQIKEEEEKKKTNKDQIESWKERIEEIDKTLEENKEKAIDAIFGEDLQSAISDFAEAYADAVSAGEDRWVSVKDTVKEMMKQMVVESIKGALQSSKAIENIRLKLKEFYEDQILSQAEQDAIYKMAAEVQKNIDSQFGWAEDLLKDDTKTEQNASYGGFESMSEDTGSELNGRFTALQIAGEEIKAQTIEQTLSLADIKGSLNGIFPLMQESKMITDEIRSLLAASHLELQGINENTSANVKELKRLGIMFNKWDSKIMNL